MSDDQTKPDVTEWITTAHLPTGWAEQVSPRQFPPVVPPLGVGDVLEYFHPTSPSPWPKGGDG